MSTGTDNLPPKADGKLSDIGARLKGPETAPNPKPLPLTTMRPADEGPGAAQVRATDATRAGYALALLLGRVELRTPRDFARMVLLAQQFTQTSLYCADWNNPGGNLFDLSLVNEALEWVDNQPEDNAKSSVSFSAWK